jgi:dephospho-CoA kinase
MKKYIFITNGMGGCGKDTFANFLKDRANVTKISSVDRVKHIAYEGGWDGGKTEKDRKFLSDLKCLLTEYNDLPFKSISYQVELFKEDFDADVLLIDIREPEEIERAKKAFGAKTILIKNDRVPYISSNMADAGVYNYDYDIIIENNGTLEEFEEKVQNFAKEYLYERHQKSY